MNRTWSHKGTCMLSLLIPLRTQFTVTLTLRVPCRHVFNQEEELDSLKRTSYLCVDLLLPLKPSNSITMKHLLLLPLLLWAVSYAGDTSNEQKSSTIKQPALKNTNTSNTSISTVGSDKNTTKSSKMGFDLDGAMINRALYVLIGITAIGVLYFLVRAVR